MLAHFPANGDPVRVNGVAHIVISLNSIGEATATAFCFDRLDCALIPTGDSRLIHKDIPFLLAELRMQIALGRPLTVGESADLKKTGFQPLAGSLVTE